MSTEPTETATTERWTITGHPLAADQWCVIRLKDGHIEHGGSFNECNALLVRLKYEATPKEVDTVDVTST